MNKLNLHTYIIHSTKLQFIINDAADVPEHIKPSLLSSLIQLQNKMVGLNRN